jgi:hypothetical protein
LKDHIKISKKKRALISQNSPMSINEESGINKICIDSNNQKIQLEINSNTLSSFNKKSLKNFRS